MITAPLEGEPTGDQKRRLEDWLTELMIICRRYRLLLDTDDGETRVIDTVTGHTVGLGLTSLINDRGRITGYDCSGSILDGVWLVDTPAGPVEQRTLGSIWPTRPSQERPT